MSWRDAMCGELRAHDAGRRVTVAGWADTRRDHGGLIFVDLRDHTGKVQLVLNPERAPAAAQTAHEIRNEFVLQATGDVVTREPELVNPNLPTGQVEVQVDELRIVSRSTPLPFQLDEEGVDETLRLRYRWLDLRRERLQRNIRLRGQMVGIMRRLMEDAGFVDIQTPILWKPTPEGARDFLVPARLQPGHFYALPQSPQIAKQLLVIAGFERYFQVAICFRDEDLRADRVQEITQLDVEMAFPDYEFLLALTERLVQEIWRECLGVELATPFLRMTWDEADRRFGSDKPDLRYGLEIEDATEATRGSEFGVFSSAEAVRFLRVPRTFSRAELAQLEEFAKEWGAKGLAYLVYDESGEVRSPIAKFLSEETLAALGGKPGETLLFAADRWPMTTRVLGPLRVHLADTLGLIRRGHVVVVLGDRLPDVRVVGDGRALDRRPPSVHPADRGVGGALRRRSRQRARLRLRPDRQRERARRRFFPDPRAGDPGARLRPARDQRRATAGEVRLPPRRARHGRAAARRHRLGRRPDDDGARERAEPARHDRVPQEPGGCRSDDGRAERRRGRAPARAWDSLGGAPGVS